MGKIRRSSRDPHGHAVDKSPATPKGPRPKILILDDDDLFLGSLTALLRQHGYETATAQNAFEALEKLDQEIFHLIIADIRLRGIDGVKTLEALRCSDEDHFNKDVPVIFISGFPDKKLEIEARKLNPLGHLQKPFDDSELLSILKSYLPV